MSWQSTSPGAAVRAPLAARGRAVRRAGEAAAADAPGASIQEVCRETGLSARTLRYYEELGLLPGVRRRAGGRRVYGADELERLRFIQRLKALGLTLEEVRELNAVHAIGGSTRGMLAHLDALLSRRLAEVDERMAELRRLRDEIARYRHHVTSRRNLLAARRNGS